MSTDPLNIGLSGLEAYSTEIDVGANNVANAGTAGFQAQGVEFQQMFNGAVAARIATNGAAGGLDPTGSATSVAIAGAGFFVLAGPNGNTTYTRDGNFVPSGNGVLVDAASGFPVTGVNGGTIAIPANASNLAIAADGSVTATVNGTSVTLGRVALAAFANPGGLERVSGGYQASANSGNDLLGAPGTAGFGALVPGFLETSNVDLANEFVNMIAAQAAFDANAKSVRTADAMLKTAIDIDAPQREA